MRYLKSIQCSPLCNRGEALTSISVPLYQSAAAPPTAIDIPAGVALPVWVLVVLVISRELGLGNLLKSFQDGRQKSSESASSLTEKVVTQVLAEYGELTQAIEKLTDKIEQLREETKESSELICLHLKTLAERERLAIVAASRNKDGSTN